MPFGATRTFCLPGPHDSVFRDLVDVYVMHYLDDIIVYSKSEADRKDHVTEILRRLRQEKLL
jgi:hypothetical protein